MGTWLLFMPPQTGRVSIVNRNSKLKWRGYCHKSRCAYMHVCRVKLQNLKSVKKTEFVYL